MTVYDVREDCHTKKNMSQLFGYEKQNSQAHWKHMKSRGSLHTIHVPCFSPKLPGTCSELDREADARFCLQTGCAKKQDTVQSDKHVAHQEGPHTYKTHTDTNPHEIKAQVQAKC